MKEGQQFNEKVPIECIFHLYVLVSVMFGMPSLVLFDFVTYTEYYTNWNITPDKVFLHLESILTLSES